MSKESIKWHEECCENWKSFLDRRIKEFKNWEKQLGEAEREYQFYVFQIESAKKEKKDGFDEGRYKVKRSK